LIANKKAYQDNWKRKKIDNIAMLLTGALRAEVMVGLKMNVRRFDLDKVLSALPALKKPTVSHLSDENWSAIDTVIEEFVVREIIPQLKEAGAEDIVEYPLNKVVL